MADLDLADLRSLRILLEERNVTRAARKLGVSQPAVSARLRGLRARLGDTLLVRGPAGALVATPRAEALLPEVRRVLDDLRRLGEPPGAFDPATAELTMELAATDYVQAVLLPPLLEMLGRLAPGLRVAVRPIMADQLGDQLASGAVQLALMPRGNAPPSARSLLLCEERFVCAMRCGHPLVTDGAMLTLDAYCALSHVLAAPTGHDFRGVVDRALEGQGRARRVRVSVPSFFAAAELVRCSDDIATLPERLVRLYDGALLALATPLPVPGFTIAAVWHERADRDPALAWVRAKLRKAIESRPPTRDR